MSDELDCGCSPQNCTCFDEGTPTPSLCDGDLTNNEWVTEGVCLLDQMTPSQVTYVLQRNPKAREDLKRATTCQELHDLVDQVPLLDTREEEDRLQSALNNNANSLPFYTLFRGNLNNS